MKNPCLPGKIILSTASLLILMGTLSSVVYSNFQNIISASHGKTSAVPLEMVEGNKLVDDLSRTSSSWRRTLSKHIFITIDQELQSLEQQLTRHNNTKGKRFIKRVRVSLEKMKSGKQNFVRTGQEPSLSLFYNGRTVLEYNLWKLKNLTRNLNMDPAHTRSLFRVYALMNKWLVYVAHREISARRKGTLPLRTKAEQTGKQDTEKTNTTFPQISEVAKITEQDFEKADKALSQQPAAVQKNAPDVNSETFGVETLESPEPQTRKKPQPNLVIEEDIVSPQNFEEGVDSPEASSIPNWVFMLGMAGMILVSFLLFRRKRKSTHLPPFHRSGVENHLEYDDQNTDELVEIHTLIESRPTGDTGEEWPNDNGTEEPATNSITMKGIPAQIMVNMLESESQEDMTFQLEGLTQELEILHAEKEEITQGMESILAENDSLTEKLEDFHAEKEGLEKQLGTLRIVKEELIQELETLRTEKGELTQGMENILAENDSLTEKLETFRTGKEGLEKQLAALRSREEELTRKLETLHAEKEEIAQEQESTLAENNSLTKQLKASCEAKESLETQLEALHSREEELTQKLKSILTENDSLAKQLEALQTEKEDLENQLEILRIEKEEYAQKLGALHTEKEESFQILKNKLMESNSLTEKLEASRTEKEGLEKQLEALHSKEEELTRKSETLHAEKEKIAQERESTLAENNSLTKQLETSHEDKERLEAQLEALHSREDKLAQGLESTLTESDSLTEKLETSHAEEDFKKQLETLRIEKEELAQELKTLHSREDKLAQGLENTLAENDSLTENLKASQEEEEKELLKQGQKSGDAKFKAMTETLESTREKNKTLEKEQKNIHSKIKTLTQQIKIAQEEIKGLAKDLKSTSTKKEALTIKLKAAQKKNKTITKKNKALTNQLEIAQTENTQTAESEHTLTRELEALSVEAKNLKEKLESTFSENEMLQKQLEITQAETDQRTADGADDLTRELEALSVEAKELKEKLEFTYLKNETLAQEKPQSANTIDLSFDHDPSELMASQTEESVMDDETTEDMTFSILNSAKDLERNDETLAGDDAIKENQDIPSGSLPSDQETSHSDVILLQTILKAAKGFRNINERLYKIAEARLSPSVKNSPEDSKENDSRKS